MSVMLTEFQFCPWFKLIDIVLFMGTYDNEIETKEIQI